MFLVVVEDGMDVVVAGDNFIDGQTGAVTHGLPVITLGSHIVPAAQGICVGYGSFETSQT